VSQRVSKYLAKQSLFARWPLQSPSTEGVEKIVAIPALAEDPGLFDTLRDLSRNDPSELGRTLVIVVVNNREIPHSPPEDIENNQVALMKLRRFGEGLRLSFVDAASPGQELPEKEGVGLARKIGLDWGLEILFQNCAEQGALISLDADTRVEPNYLTAITKEFIHPTGWAGVVDYAHPVDDPSIDESRRSAISQYELFLRYHELGLAYAGSPYAFPTIGSAMVCTGEAYAAVSGMKRTQAGEDFYFLQALAKSGPIRKVRGTTVHPSSRPSHRVPFGTGNTIRSILGGDIEGVPLYPPESYSILKRWLSTVRSHLEEDGDGLTRLAEKIDTRLSAFLTEQNFLSTWDRIRMNAKSPDRRLEQFHRWFDAFRTLRLFHRLRDRGHPDVSAQDGIGWILAGAGETGRTSQASFQSDLASEPAKALRELRRLCRDLPPTTSLID
jgi:hypothetical protein